MTDRPEKPAPPLAPGRYCLAVCYCQQCPHWKPSPPVQWNPQDRRRDRDIR